MEDGYQVKYLSGMEERKQKEINYYNDRAREWLVERSDENKEGDFEGFNPHLLSSYAFCYQTLEGYCQGKKILDYGCGNGVHSIFLAKYGKEVIGIDLSESSLQIAREKARKERVEDKVEFLLMDCEKLDFPDNTFDIIFDGGTFSSLDIKKVLPELSRILKPEGFLVGIETLGHNPFANLKRKINKKTGKRTEWAVKHIMRMENLKEMESYFDKVEIKFFHLISWIIFPFLKVKKIIFLLKPLEVVDRIFLNLSFLRKYSFKVVFVFKSKK